MLIAHRKDWDVENNLVVWGQRENQTDELKIDIGLVSLTIEPVKSVVRVIDEHSIIWIEKLLHQELEEFFLDTTLINSRLIFENDSQWLLDLTLVCSIFNDGLQSVLQNQLSSNFKGEMSVS